MWYFPRWSQITAAVALVLLLGFAVSPYAPHHREDHSSSQSAQEADPNTRIADYTEWLAILTGALVISAAVQLGFFVRGDASTRIAANAAKASSEALPTVERAYLFLAPGTAMVNVAHKHPDMRDLKANRTVKYSYQNFGRTPAVVVASSVKATVMDAPPTPRDVEALPSATLRSPAVVGERSTYIYQVGEQFFLSDDEYAAVIGGRRRLYFWGRIRYTDIFGTSHNSDFITEFEATTGSFMTLYDHRT